MRKTYDTIIGVDASLTDTGMARLELIVSKCILVSISSSADVGSMADPLRQTLITDMFEEHCKRAKGNVAVVIEGYALGKFQGKIRERAELVGMIKYVALCIYGFDVYMVGPTSLKKFMGVAKGNKKSDKAAMGFACRQKFQFNHENDNIVDAYCLTRYLVANLNGERLTIVRHLGIRNNATVQVPANSVEIAKNLQLTTDKPKPKFTLLQRPTKPTR